MKIAAFSTNLFIMFPKSDTFKKKLVRERKWLSLFFCLKEFIFSMVYIKYAKIQSWPFANLSTYLRNEVLTFTRILGSSWNLNILDFTVSSMIWIYQISQTLYFWKLLSHCIAYYWIIWKELNISNIRKCLLKSIICLAFGNGTYVT